jgi:hypothetical protein
MCSKLPGFGIDSPLLSDSETILEEAEPESGKAVVKIGPHPSDVLSIGSFFDETGIGKRILPQVVCNFTSALAQRFILVCRPTLRITPKRLVAQHLE